jgi:catechol-2,3-dioxygenase
MKKYFIFLLVLTSLIAFSQEKSKDMELGAFSVSLSVKDIHKAKEFYEKLGFTQRGGDIKQNWVVMKNGNSVIGLFQGMFEGNWLTFNPGWDQDKNELKTIKDVREIQKDLKNEDIKLDREADEKTNGAEYIMLKDPDGNVILIDQHR